AVVVGVHLAVLERHVGHPDQLVAEGLAVRMHRIAAGVDQRLRLGIGVADQEDLVCGAGAAAIGHVDGHRQGQREDPEHAPDEATSVPRAQAARAAPLRRRRRDAIRTSLSDELGQASLGSASAMRLTPSSTFFIEVAYDRRTKPGAWKADPGTTATRAASISHSHSWASFSIFLPSGVFLPMKADRSGKA